MTDQIELSEQRIRILESTSDYSSAKVEHLHLLKLKDKLNTLSKYKEESSYGNTSAPHFIQVGHYNRFGKEIIDIEYNSYSLDEEAVNYFYRNSHIKLKDWREMDEDKEYIISNLRLKREGEILYSQYPNEEFWYELNDNDQTDSSFFNKLAEQELYIVS